MILVKYNLKIFKFLSLLVLLTQCKEAPTESISIRPDLIQVTFVSPADSSFISEPPVLLAEVQSKNSIAQVNFFIDQNMLGAVTKAPYSITPDVTPWADDTMHILKCVVEDNQHNINSAEIIVYISSLVKLNITLLAPAQNDTIRYSDRVDLRWQHDPDKKFLVEIASDAYFNNKVQSDSTIQKSFLTKKLDKGSYFWRIGYFSTLTQNIFWSGVRRFSIDGPKTPTILSHSLEDIRIFKTENTFKWNKSDYAVQYQFQVLDYYTNEIIYDDFITDTLVTKDFEMYVYKVKVRAKNEVNFWSDWSPTINFSNGLYTKKIVTTGDIDVVGCLEIADSGFVIGGTHSGNFTQLIKVDALGNVKYSSDLNNFMLRKISITPDNYILLVGRNSSSQSKVVKVDQSLHTVWEYEPVDIDKINLTNISVAQNGDYLLVGDYKKYSSIACNRVYFSGLSSSGMRKFEYVVGDSVSFGYNIQEKNNNYFIMAKHIDTIYISTSIKNLIVDQNGTILTEYRFLVWQGSGPSHILVDGSAKSDNVFCYGYNGIANGSYLHKSDIFGTEYWIINLGNSSTIAQDIAETTDGNLLVGGYEHETFLGKIISDGSYLWRYHYNTNTYCRDILNTVDGGILMMMSTFQGPKESYLVKMNKDGITYKN